MNSLLAVDSLHVQFRLPRGRRLHAVDGVSFTLARGEVLGLVGESGSGKSTLGRAITGLQRSTSGTVHLDGQRLPDAPGPADFRARARDMAMIFQDPMSALNPRMDVADILREPLRLLGIGTPAEQRALAAEWLLRCGLREEHLERRPHEFSGGQRQRICIARALITQPRFVVCDEPVSALDVSLQAQIVNLLAELRARLGLALLFISHDIALVRHLADRVAVMYLGVLVEEGPAAAVCESPLHPYTRLLVDSVPEPDPVRERQRARAPLAGEIGSAIDVGAGCRFAPRCPQASARCHAETPAMRRVDAARRVACHLFD